MVQPEFHKPGDLTRLDACEGACEEAARQVGYLQIGEAEEALKWAAMVRSFYADDRGDGERRPRDRLGDRRLADRLGDRRLQNGRRRNELEPGWPTGWPRFPDNSCEP